MEVNTFGIINRIEHVFLGNIVIYEALGQVILPLGLSTLGQFHLPSGFINHDIAQKEVFYSVNICPYVSIFCIYFSVCFPRFCVRPHPQCPGSGFILWAAGSQCCVCRHITLDEWLCVPGVGTSAGDSCFPVTVSIKY